MAEASSNSVNVTIRNIRVNRHGSYFSFMPFVSLDEFIEFPPALTQAQLQEIPKATITKEHAAELIQCTVCLEEFKLYEDGIRKLPCNHMYHETCIFPWLETNQTCPACRKPLPNANNNANYLDNVIRQNFDILTSGLVRHMRDISSFRMEELFQSEEQNSSPRVFRPETPVVAETVRGVPRREAAVRARRAISRIYR